MIVVETEDGTTTVREEEELPGSVSITEPVAEEDAPADPFGEDPGRRNDEREFLRQIGIVGNKHPLFLLSSVLMPSGTVFSSADEYFFSKLPPLTNEQRRLLAEFIHKENEREGMWGHLRERQDPDSVAARAKNEKRNREELTEIGKRLFKSLPRRLRVKLYTLAEIGLKARSMAGLALYEHQRSITPEYLRAHGKSFGYPRYLAHMSKHHDPSRVEQDFIEMVNFHIAGQSSPSDFDPPMGVEEWSQWKRRVKTEILKNAGPLDP